MRYITVQVPNAVLAEEPSTGSGTEMSLYLIVDTEYPNYGGTGVVVARAPNASLAGTVLDALNASVA